MAEDNGFAMGYALGQDSGGTNGGSGIWSGDAIWGILLFAMIFGWGRGGFGGGFGGGYEGGGGYATQADVRAAVDQQTLISKLDQQTYGLADTFTALNNTLNNNFRGLDNAICNLGFQNQQCCCDTRAAIKDVSVGIERTGWNLSKQISDCCCDLEKMNMQGRFDAQMYNNNTLMAIDKLGDRIIDYMAQNEKQALRDENQALRLAASQSRQNQYLIDHQRYCIVVAQAIPDATTITAPVFVTIGGGT